MILECSGVSSTTKSFFQVCWPSGGGRLLAPPGPRRSQGAGWGPLGHGWGPLGATERPHASLPLHRPPPGAPVFSVTATILAVPQDTRRSLPSYLKHALFFLLLKSVQVCRIHVGKPYSSQRQAGFILPEKRDQPSHRQSSLCLQSSLRPATVPTSQHPSHLQFGTIGKKNAAQE